MGWTQTDPKIEKEKNEKKKSTWWLVIGRSSEDNFAIVDGQDFGGWREALCAVLGNRSPSPEKNAQFSKTHTKKKLRLVSNFCFQVLLT